MSRDDILGKVAIGVLMALGEATRSSRLIPNREVCSNDHRH